MICKKRTIFTLLVIIVLYLSSSLTCFAAGDGNIDNGGGSMGQGTATDIWHHEDGVRVTVVALDGTIVSVPFDLTNFDIEDNIDKTYNLKTVGKIIEYMADVFISQGNSELRIGDDIIDREVVKQKLMTIGLSEMKQVVLALNSSVIKNPRKYAISMLYNL